MTASTHDAHVELHDVHFSYRGDQDPLFAGFDWRVARGEIWAVAGPSGCGKSTLLTLIAGLRQPAAGQILVGSAPVPRPRASTGLILQDHGLLPWATVHENATLGLRMGRFYRNKRTPADQPRPYPPPLPLAEAERWLERLGLAGLADKYPAQLSGGQRQRVAIARALAIQPDLLLMDEPFSALDPAIRADLQELVAGLQQELGLTVLLVTHSIEEAAFLGARILLLSQPPNRQVRILDNPGAGARGHRHSPAYARVVRQLQDRLGAAEPA
jgi:ABC-type nitrate/sulfonate/bicarbonate transport system ATPase subunit